MPLIPRSPLFYASVGLAVLAFAAPGRAHAQAAADDEPKPIAARPQVDVETEELLPESTLPAATAPATNEIEPAGPAAREQSRWDRTRFEGAFGVGFGNFTLNGDSSGTAIPFSLDLGVRRHRWLVYGSYDVLGVTAHVPAVIPGDIDTARTGSAAEIGDGSGLAHRVGANARYAFGRMGESDGGFEVWAEGGLGIQHMRWDAGGTWTRPDLALGIGGTILGLGNTRHGGFSMGLRIMLAPRNDTANRPPVCGGPCDTATPPASLDHSFLFDVSVPFGT